jgi:prepilin-type N-terminal cleavage/methylation domain-containing protein
MSDAVTPLLFSLPPLTFPFRNPTMNARRRLAGPLPGQRGFTLVELILVLAIIGILSSLGLAIIAGAQEDAQVSRTRAQIDRISLVLNQRLEESVYRILPVDLSGLTQKEKAWVRTAAIAELLRVEFPTRQSDLLDITPANPAANPPEYPFPVNEKYRLPNPPPHAPRAVTGYDWSFFPDPQLMVRHRVRLGMPTNGSALGTWTAANESAECLYAILASITMEDGKSALSLVSASEIGDKDADGRKEILDAFGDPLLADLVVRDLVDEHGNRLNPLVDPHINPAFDRDPELGPPMLADPDYPVELGRYQFMILSSNVAGKLE